MKKDKGITLIALIVTIIILLILAGITIGAITGDNGIINQAQSAKTENERSDIEEQINVIVIQNSKDRVMDKNKLINDFEEKLPDGKEIVESDDLIYIIYPEYSFEVDIDSLEVAQVEIDKADDETPWELSGSGTEADPYLIESIEDLVAFSNNVNSGTSYSDEYVKLTRDLDFNLPFSYVNPKTKVSEKTNRIIEEDSNGTELKTFLTSGTGFNPIGNEEEEFRGTFDGNGKVIKNIYINRPEEDYVALMGYSSSLNTIIKRLGISSGYIVGNKYVAGIIASAGIAKLCYNNAQITGKSAVGGIASYWTSIENSYNTGKIEIISSNISMSSVLAIGGIEANQQTSSLKNCYNAGNIEVGRTYGAGGITGFYGNISNCYNIGKVEGNSYYLAGIIGGSDSTDTITGCYNTGNIIGDGSSGVSGNGKGNIKECYYLEGSALGGIKGQDIEGQAMPLPKSEMPSVISVLMTDNEQVEWNGQMVDVWKEDTNNINNGYPILYWQ